MKFEPIGILHSCFKEKFGIPRQPGLVAEAKAIIKLKDDPLMRNALREIEGFSHLWVIFIFHQTGSRNWKPSIRPPRLGGAKKVGVLASRSPHRPNPIGLSAVKLDRVDWDALEGIEIHVSGVDILDQSPVLDIKPYLPYADSIPDATSGWADEPIVRTPVEFTSSALHTVEHYIQHGYPQLLKLIEEMLSLDPRPAFQKRRFPPESSESQGKAFAFLLLDFDIHWEIQDQKFLVKEVIELKLFAF